MAQVKDLIVNGSARIVGDIISNGLTSSTIVGNSVTINNGITIDGATIGKTGTTSQLLLVGGTGTTTGGCISLRGKDCTTGDLAGSIYIQANNGSSLCTWQFQPDGVVNSPGLYQSYTSGGVGYACLKSDSEGGTIELKNNDQGSSAVTYQIDTYANYLRVVNCSSNSELVKIASDGTITLGGTAFIWGNAFNANRLKVNDGYISGCNYICGFAKNSSSTYETPCFSDSVYYDRSGNIYAISYDSSSSRKVKENISLFSDSALDIINDTEIVNFTYISDEDHNRRVGFIADDTNEIIAGKNHDKMDLNNCIGILLKSVQELSSKVTSLESEISSLKEEINTLKSEKADS